MRREDESIGREDHVIRHFARGLQVLVQQRGRHGQGFAGVIEAGRIGRIHRKLPGGTDVHARQVADRVVVLGVAEPAGQHQAGIACILGRLTRAHGPDPENHLLTGVRRRLFCLLWRHLLGRKFLKDQTPVRNVPPHCRHCGVRT